MSNDINDVTAEALKALDKADADIAPYINVSSKKLSSSLTPLENARLVTMYTFIATSLMYCKYIDELISCLFILIRWILAWRWRTKFKSTGLWFSLMIQPFYIHMRFLSYERIIVDIRMYMDDLKPVHLIINLIKFYFPFSSIFACPRSRCEPPHDHGRDRIGQETVCTNRRGRQGGWNEEIKQYGNIL